MHEEFLPQFCMEIIFLSLNSDLTLLSTCSGSFKTPNTSFQRNSKQKPQVLQFKKNKPNQQTNQKKPKTNKPIYVHTTENTVDRQIRKSSIYFKFSEKCMRFPHLNQIIGP